MSVSFDEINRAAVKQHHEKCRAKPVAPKPRKKPVKQDEKGAE